MFGRKRLLQLERESAELRDALQWYAEERHWRRKKINAKGEPRQWVKSPASDDRGDRARTVLFRFPGEPAPTWVDRLLDWLCGPEDQPVPWRARPAQPHPHRRASDAPPAEAAAGAMSAIDFSAPAHRLAEDTE
jgi:hypothetical protein